MKPKLAFSDLRLTMNCRDHIGIANHEVRPQLTMAMDLDRMEVVSRKYYEIESKKCVHVNFTYFHLWGIFSHPTPPIFCRIDEEMAILLAKIFRIKQFTEAFHHGHVNIAFFLVEKYARNSRTIFQLIKYIPSIYCIPVHTWPHKFSMRGNYWKSCWRHWSCWIRIHGRKPLNRFMKN